MLIKHSLSAFYPYLLAGLTAALLGLATGCTYSQGNADAAPSPCDADLQSVTYSRVISPIFDANCRQCHGSNVAATLGGSLDLGDYQKISRYSDVGLLGSIRHAPGFLPMPKGQAKISECDIRRIEAWIAAKKPNN